MGMCRTGEQLIFRAKSYGSHVLQMPLAAVELFATRCTSYRAEKNLTLLSNEKPQCVRGKEELGTRYWLLADSVRLFGTHEWKH